MRKPILFLMLCFILVFSAHGQVISQFTWDSNPVTQATVGPNGTAVNSTATSSPGGSTGNGLNPGTGGSINLVIPGSTFELPGLDVSIDFQKEENGASFFALGNLDFGISTGSLYADLPLSTGTIALNNIYLVPATGWHTYRFVYNNNNGVFTLSVDGTVQYTHTVTSSVPLVWTGATTVTVGGAMDGSNHNVSELDNLVVQVPSAILPLHLLSFEAVNHGNFNALNWTGAEEDQLLNYTVERSDDGTHFTAIGQISPAPDHSYTFADNTPPPTSFYRLRIADIDGGLMYSDIKRVSRSVSVSLSCYPNPVIGTANLQFQHAPSGHYYYHVVDAAGRMIQSGSIVVNDADQQVGLNMMAAPKGILFIQVFTEEGVVSTFDVLKN